MSAWNWRADASLRPQPRREGPDYWPTPDCLVRALVNHVLPTLPSGVVWEVGGGDGRLAEALRAARREVIATDLYQEKRPLDFLQMAVPSAGSRVWALPPPRAMLDGDGNVRREIKIRYVPVVGFFNHGTRSSWSQQIVKAQRAQSPDALLAETDAP